MMLANRIVGLGSVALVGLVVGLASAPAAAQDPGSFPTNPLLRPTVEESPFQPVGRWGLQQDIYDPFDMGTSYIGNQLPLDPERLASRWMQPEAFQGFPVFPTSLGGFGSYPPPPSGFMQPPTPSTVPPPAQVPSAPNWPAWVTVREKPQLPYNIDTAVVVRQSDRVWVRDVGEPAMTPLYFWDISRAVSAGAKVSIPQTGDFLVLFYGGTRIESFGYSELDIGKMDEKGVEFSMSSLTHCVLTAHQQSFVMKLPDGSELRSLPIPEDAAAIGTTRLFFDRIGGPDWLEGRATIFNGGARNVAVKTVFGDFVLETGMRITMFLNEPRDTFSHELVTHNVQPQVEGSVRTFTAGQNASVIWSGAEFKLAEGSTLRLDPMVGSASVTQPTGPGNGAAGGNPAAPNPTPR
ncbi:MAG: hypothetical protein VYE77_01780 [Planctomycetota bacterium]|nr:hypothetical protein [Planctomycetota bacterium]